MISRIKQLVQAVFRQEYARASIFYLIATVLGQGVVLFSSSFFTRIMSKADYGLVSTYSSWVLVLNTFICLNLFIAVRNAYIDFRDDYEAFCTTVLVLSLASGFLITVLLAGIVRATGAAVSTTEVIIACVQAISLHTINYRMAILSMKNRYVRRSALVFLPNLTHTVLSIVLVLVFTRQMYLAKIVGNASGLLLYAVISAFLIFHGARPCIKIKYWKYALALSLPAILLTLSDLILMQSDRLMLTAMIGAEETAEYSLIYNVGAILIAVYQAINGAWSAWFFKTAAKNDYKSSINCQEAYLALFSFITVGVITVGPELIKILSPANYWYGIRYMGWIVLASYLIFEYAFFTTLLMFKKRVAAVALNTVAAAVLNLGLNYFLIPRMHSAGAVIATVVSYSLLFILHIIASGSDGKRFFSLKLSLAHILFILIYCIAFLFMKDIWYVRYALLFVISAVAYLIYGKQLLSRFLKKDQHSEQ